MSVESILIILELLNLHHLEVLVDGVVIALDVIDAGD